MKKSKDIKVIANYPTTPEGMKLLDESIANATLLLLRKMLTPEQLEKLMKNLEEKQKLNKTEN